jgi:ribosomal protein S18 acetylase RimI-like enzyme
MEALIREMRMGDYSQVRELWKEAQGIEVTSVDSPNSIQRFLERNPGLSFVALDGDQIVGAVLCGHDGRRGYIDHLAVKPSHRMQGIGRSLVNRCVFNLMQKGIRRWHLFVQEDNQPAIAFWRKLGWAARVELVTMTRGNAGGE